MNPGNPFAGGNLEQALQIFLGVLCLAMIFTLVLCILFLATLQKAIDRCSEPNRTMRPAQVWLCLIPLFGIFWIFPVVWAVADSLRNEFVDRGIDRGRSYGRTIGSWWLAMSLLLVTLLFVGTISGQMLLWETTIPLWIAGASLFAIYWVMVAGYSRQLQRNGIRDVQSYPDEPTIPVSPDERIR